MDMKVYVRAYIMKNLGDDLFIKIISEKYSKHTLIISQSAKYLNLQNRNILYYTSNKFTMIIDKILTILSLGKISSMYFRKKHADTSILIGGSMFIEQKNSNLIKTILNLQSKSFYDYIIGVNFGPYKSNKFYKKYYKVFKNARDVCFRDKYSYNLFKDIKHCRYAPDIIFSLDTNKYNNTNSKRVIISVIDCDKRFSNEIANNYYSKIVEIINYYRNSNYKVCLMSFCKREGDEVAIEKILNLLNDFVNIETYLYDGNIDGALNKIGDSSIIVGTRFHANVLGMVFGKKIIPISYSDKTINMLEDIGFNGVSYDIRKINSFDISKLNDISNNYVDVSKLKKDALLHFKELDKILK